MLPQTIDVLIVGGGPTGLLTTYNLLRFGVNAHIIEQRDRTQQVLYGRACVLHSASIEHLDAAGVLEPIADVGFIISSSATFKNGEQLPNRGWKFTHEAHKAGHTFFEYSLGVRQRWVEDALLERISNISSGHVHAPARLIKYHPHPSNPDYPVLATVEVDGETTQISCKYLVGADGGRSLVRSLGKFPFPTVASPFKWVRLDAVVKTDMPSARIHSIAVESQKYGNILWLPVDSGRTRIGFVCPDEVYGRDGTQITNEVIMETARKALLPFTLEFVTLDWWTVYEIGQGVAEKFRDGRVILAGDAAHTHSSGSAQGMNTGIYDASNLSWKLAGVLTGKFDESLLDTYDSERRASAQHLIDLDKEVSMLISGKIPDRFDAPLNADVNDYLDQVFRENAQFTVGLGVSYTQNLLNQIYPKPAAAIKIGYRAPDALVYPPRPVVGQRLRSLTPNMGHFWVLIFAGTVSKRTDAQPVLDSHCAERYKTLKERLDSYNFAKVCNFLTILHGESIHQSSEAMGTLPIGNVVLDHGDAYSLYGVDPREGAVVVVRSDGIVSFCTGLDGADQLHQYFSRFSHIGSNNSVSQKEKADCHVVAGEISVEGQDERSVQSHM